MKTRSIKLSLLAITALTGGALGQTTTWFYGSGNNSANYSVTADNYSSLGSGWQDGWASQLTGTTGYDTVSIQTNAPQMFGTQQAGILYGFDGTGLNSAQVSTAMLYLRQDYSSTSQTWTIYGLATGNTGWDSSNMTWADLDTSSATDWTGDTLVGSLGSTYGTFSTTGLDVDTNISVDITDAFKAYLDGSISGIAFMQNANGTTLNGGDRRLIVFSDENLTSSNLPGLLVTQVPEPSTAILGLLGSLALLRRRR
ncbi:hypothetical protein HNR46_001977 [Haloferula luteola]|uniref:Ice-binding protein C-terminal domain-containing protein n=1 Tax=Haloferula luteola TaxID=595692 RepID=A0A840VAM7_9BACT|nr:DNRLRE domain-containing protein [Haloferula luteola]MBB5351738.1 hypothetical protein [Haloferula luteola]